MVVSGGYDGSNSLNDLWQLKLAPTPAWVQLSPGGTPQSARWGQPAIYDPVRDRMVLFGGNTGATDSHDASAVKLSGATSWVPLTPLVGALSARGQDAAVYDPVRDRMLVEFGSFGPAFYDDVGAFPLAGISPTFTLATAGALPPRRSGHIAIYDPVRDRIVVFGGTTVGGSKNNVWALSLSGSPAWTQLATTGVPPSPRTESAASYDPIRDRLVVSCGRLDGFTWYGDIQGLLLSGTLLWHFVGTSIQPVSGHSAVYDSAHDRLVLFGGFTGGAGTNAVVGVPLVVPSQFAEFSPGGPQRSSRFYHGAIYDPRRDQMVVFGGLGSAGTLLPGDVVLLRWGSTLGVWPQAGPPGSSLAPAFPNRSRGDLSIAFALRESGDASLRVYDVTGRLVRSLVEGALAAGTHSARWGGRTMSGSKAAAGLYFCELRAFCPVAGPEDAWGCRHRTRAERRGDLAMRLSCASAIECGNFWSSTVSPTSSTPTGRSSRRRSLPRSPTSPDAGWPRRSRCVPSGAGTSCTCCPPQSR